MIETLQFGGGIISVKPVFSDPAFEDFGYCDEFTVKVEHTEEYRDKYIRSGSGLIRVKTSEGRLVAASITGSFICESITRARLQSMWFRGSASSTGTEILDGDTFEAVISGLKFLSVSDSGPIECLKLPKVSLKLSDNRKLMGYEWRNLPFTFEAFLEEGYMPSLRVQQEGETLTNFCD